MCFVLGNLTKWHRLTLWCTQFVAGSWTVWLRYYVTQSSLYMSAVMHVILLQVVRGTKNTLITPDSERSVCHYILKESPIEISSSSDVNLDCLGRKPVPLLLQLNIDLSINYLNEAYVSPIQYKRTRTVYNVPLSGNPSHCLEYYEFLWLRKEVQEVNSVD